MTAKTSCSTDEVPDGAIQILLDTLGDEAGLAGRCRKALAVADENLIERFRAGDSVARLVKTRSDIIDTILFRLWHECAGEVAGNAALIAVGGYGRGELHPCSDVDIMILVEDPLPENAATSIAAFFTAL